MTSDYLVVDLTALVPSWRDGEDNEGEIWPSYCLPWFHGEPPLVGMSSQKHRRGTDFNAEDLEARLDLENRARFHWAEGWLDLMQHPDSPRSHKAHRAWLPPGDLSARSVGVDFAEAVREVVRDIQRNKPHFSRLGLVVPAGLGSGPQEELVKALDVDFEEVQLFPRPIAIALHWIQSELGTVALQGWQEQGGPYLGSLLITNTPSDYWEMTTVKLRVDGEGDTRVICPVQDRTKYPSEFGVVGLACATAVASGVDTDSERPGWLYWLREKGSYWDGEVDTDRYQESLSNLSSSVSWTDQVSEDCSRVLQHAQSLHANDRILGHVHVGVTQSGGIPDQFGDMYGMPDPILLEQRTILQGAAEGMRRLGSKNVPYYEALAPLELRVHETNQFRDPVEMWRPLLTNTEVPAGEEYRSKKPIRDLALPGGAQEDVDLYIRTTRVNRVEYRLMKQSLKYPQEDPEPVSVSARMRPGRGQARVQVTSVAPGRFHAELREQAIEVVDAPGEMNYAWPPGNAVVLSRGELAQRHLSTFQAAIAEAERLGELEDESLRSVRIPLSIWLLPAQAGIDECAVAIPDGIHPAFAYVGVGSSGEEYPLDDSVRDMIEELCPIIETAVTKYDPCPYINLVLSVAGWLYGRCPDGVLHRIREHLDQDLDKKAYVECAGKCFTGMDDFRLFFESFARRIQRPGAPMLQWWRAYRNLARLRHDALSLEVMDRERHKLIFNCYLRQFRAYAEDPQSVYFGEFVRLAPHMLKRRRFDPDFLRPQTESWRKMRAVLRRAGSRAIGVRHSLAECALDYLNETATKRTITKHGGSDTDPL